GEAHAYLEDSKEENTFGRNDGENARSPPGPHSRNLFARYCASCHSDEQGYGQLPLENLGELSKVPSICAEVSKGMPPHSHGVLQPTDLEKAQMLKMLACPSY